jgi:serine protease
MVAPGGDASVDLNGDGLGDGVLSTLVDDSVTPRAHYYEIYEGTSMAAPHVAGVAALMKSIAPAMTHADFETLLMSGTITEDLGTAGRDDFYGWGLIDAYAAATAAINLAGGIIPPPIPILAANTGALNFGAFRDTLPLVLSNATGGALSITSISSDQGFVTAAAQSVDVDGLGTYDITVNRSSLDDGPASATLTITSTANTLTLTVFLYEGGAFLPHSGRQYILVIDPDTQKTVARMERQGPGGVYEFQFLSLREGEYYLLAGSDQDNDGYICDSGESCGGYPTLGTLERIVLDTDLLDLEFESGFPSALNSSATATGGEVTLAPTPGPFAR